MPNTASARSSVSPAPGVTLGRFSFGEGKGAMVPGNETMPLEITNDPDSARFIIQELIKALRGPDGKASSRAKALAITKLQEARFWLGEDMFGEGKGA